MVRADRLQQAQCQREAAAPGGVGGRRADHGEPTHTGGAHPGDDIASADRVGADGLSGERNPQGGKHRVSVGDDLSDGGRLAHVHSSDGQIRARQREVRGLAGNRDDAVPGGERVSGQQPAGLAVGAENHDAHVHLHLIT